MLTNKIYSYNINDVLTILLKEIQIGYFIFQKKCINIIIEVSIFFHR